MDDLERVLSGEPRIEPSPGFTDRVMGKVRREAWAPKPIPFPWTRFAIGMGSAWALVLGALVFGVVQGPSTLPSSEPVIDWMGFAKPLQAGLANLPLGWKLAAATVLFSVLMVPVSLRFAGYRN